MVQQTAESEVAGQSLPDGADRGGENRLPDRSTLDGQQGGAGQKVRRPSGGAPMGDGRGADGRGRRPAMPMNGLGVAGAGEVLSERCTKALRRLQEVEPAPNAVTVAMMAAAYGQPPALIARWFADNELRGADNGQAQPLNLRLSVGETVGVKEEGPARQSSSASSATGASAGGLPADSFGRQSGVFEPWTMPPELPAVRHPGLKLNIPPLLFCMSWCPDVELPGT